MHTSRTAFFLALSLTLYATPIHAQNGQPTTGAATTFQIELTEGSNLVSLPALPDSMRVGAIVADALPHLTFVQDDEGRYFIPVQGIDGIGTWAWDEAYRITVTAPTSFIVQGPAILPETSPLLLDGQVGNWVPYFRREPIAVEEAFVSIASSLSRVEAADGRFYAPGDGASTLDSLRTGQGYKVWVSAPVTLTYPANAPSQGDGPPAAGGPPTFTLDGYSQRLYGTADHQGKSINSMSVTGRRLIVGTGTHNNPGFASRWGYAQPSGDSLAAFYTQMDGSITPLPWFGGTVTAPYVAGSEHDAVSACGDLVFHHGDDGQAGGIEGPHWQDLATEAFGLSTLYGASMAQGAKHSPGVWNDDCSVLSIGFHHEAWPSTLYSFDGGQTFRRPSKSGPGSGASTTASLTMSSVWVGDTNYVWTQSFAGGNGWPLLGKAYQVAPDSMHHEVIAQSYTDFWAVADQDAPINGTIYGPNPNADLFDASTYGETLFFPVTGKYLYVWSEGGPPRRVEAKPGGGSPQVHYFAHRDSLYKLEPDGDILRLLSITGGTGAATPAWEAVSTITAPAGWDLTYGFPGRIRASDAGDLYIGTNLNMVLPFYGTTQYTPSVAWYAPGIALPARLP